MFGRWTGEFDLEPYFPKDSEVLTLGNLSFVAYLPQEYGAARRNPNGAGEVTVSFTVKPLTGSPKHYPHWAVSFDNVQTGDSGFPLTDLGGVPVVVHKGDTLLYEVTMSSAKSQGGTGMLNTMDGRDIASPILDEISLTYFLPNAQILLKERVHN
jgi:hypothetical protein